MAVNRRHLVGVFRGQADLIDEAERCPSYRVDLLRHLTSVIEAEQENRLRAINIQQRVTDECVKLGERLEGGGWTGS